MGYLYEQHPEEPYEHVALGALAEEELGDWFDV